jgi:hypothetical protein
MEEEWLLQKENLRACHMLQIVEDFEAAGLPLFLEDQYLVIDPSTMKMVKKALRVTQHRFLVKEALDRVTRPRNYYS